MIRLLFRVLGQDGVSSLHSAEVHGSKSALLLDTPNVEIIGFEDCREINPRISISFAEQIALAKQNGKDLREIVAASKLWVPQTEGPNRPGGVSATWKNEGDGGIPIPPHLATEIEKVFKDGDGPDVVYTPGEPEILCGGAENVQRQQIPASADMGLGGTAMDYRDLYEQKEVLPGVFEPRVKSTINADGLPESLRAELERVITDYYRKSVTEWNFGCGVEQVPAAAHSPGHFIVEDQQPSNSGSEVREFTTKQLPEFVVIDDPAKEGKASPTAESVAEYFRDTIASRVKKAEDEAKDESGEDPRLVHGNGLNTKLWMLMRPSGEFVKSTTEEGGESYISCTSHEEAVKVAEHQKVFDIECVPYRVF